MYIPKKWLLRLLTAAGSVVLMLVILEVGFRVYYARRDVAIMNGCKVLWSAVYSSIGEPNTEGYHRTREYKVHLKVNDEGFRENIHDRSKAGSIAILGDSFVWGTGVEEDQRFSNLLAANLDVNVLNYGLCGAGTVHELAAYLGFVEARQPSMVIITLFGNDPQNNLGWVTSIGPDNVGDPRKMIASIDYRRQITKPYWPDEDNLAGSKIGLSACWFFAEKRITEFKQSRTPKPTTTVAMSGGGTVEVDEDIMNGMSSFTVFMTGDHPVNHMAWKVTRTALTALKERCDVNGTALLAIHLPYREAIDPELWALSKKLSRTVVPDELVDFGKPGAEFAKIARDVGIDYLDMTPMLKQHLDQSGEPLYYKYDSHLTVRGNAVVAEVIEKHLKRFYSEILETAGDGEST